MKKIQLTIYTSGGNTFKIEGTKEELINIDTTLDELIGKDQMVKFKNQNIKIYAKTIVAYQLEEIEASLTVVDRLMAAAAELDTLIAKIQCSKDHLHYEKINNILKQIKNIKETIMKTK